MKKLSIAAIACGLLAQEVPAAEITVLSVGPLPAEVQNYTRYVAVPMTAAPNEEAAKALAAFLGGPPAKHCS